MSVKSKMETAQNELLNPVLTRLMQAGSGEFTGLALSSKQQQAALLIAGLLTAIKVTIMQAGRLIDESELDDLVD